MRKLLNPLDFLFVLAVVLFTATVPMWAQQNQTFPQKLYYASDYGTWDVVGQVPNTYIFSPPGVCMIPAPNAPAFVPWNVNAPVFIRDSNAAVSEVVTPSSIVATASYCGIIATTAHSHTSYDLLSGTGGLQEVLNQIASAIPYPVQVILDRNWYTLVHSVPGQTTAGVIGAVKGSTAATLVDNTTAPETYYTWNGSVYVAATQPSGTVTYNQGGTGAVTRTSTSKWQDSISIKDFGAVGDGAHEAADTAGLENAVAAAAGTGKSVYVPAGTYTLNNSSAPVLSGAQNVVIWGDGPSSSLACQTIGGQDCLASTGATGFGLMNLSVSFGPTATTRSSGYAVDLETCTNCFLEGVTLNNGDLSGLRIASSTHTSIHNLKVSNFFANGTFLVNDQDLRLDGLSCSNDGDACFETSWYDSEFTAHAVPCQDISATNITSANDVEAILVNSCNNVTVNGFASVGSAKEAVFVGQDPTTTTAHWPDRVAITGGSIYGSGYGSNTLNAATAQALYINVSTSPGSFVSHISFSNIVATHISSWGLQMAELQNDDVQASNLTFFDVGNGNTAGCVQTEGNQVNLDNVACSDVGTYAFYDTNTLRLTGSNWTSDDASQISGTIAFYLSATATGFVNVTGLSLNDNNADTYSSAVYDASSTGDHIIQSIKLTGTLTPTGPTSANENTTYTYADPTHSWVFRNGGMIMSFLSPDVYLLPTSGATSGAYVNGATFWWQSKCWSGGQVNESVAWLDQYPTLSTESFSFAHTGGCGFPITIDLTAATSVLAPLINSTATISAVHFSGYSSGTYASAPTWVAGTGAGTSPTVTANANNNDVSGYISITPGSTPAASAVVATATFGTAYATLPKCSLWPANAAASALTGTASAYIPIPSADTAFAIESGAAALSASTLYTWGYTCLQ